MHCQKVAEVEKLNQTLLDLVEVVLASGASANKEERKPSTEKRHDAEAFLCSFRNVFKLGMFYNLGKFITTNVKVTTIRIVVGIANEWKDAHAKVMPVRQWLEDHRFLQGEMQPF
ncbi:hypothetical protein MKX01_005575 [Papaver californicum]|nr:hypothetical protein MKX01_005575 [Papaver californicum]